MLLGIGLEAIRTCPAQTGTSCARYPASNGQGVTPTRLSVSGLADDARAGRPDGPWVRKHKLRQGTNLLETKLQAHSTEYIERTQRKSDIHRNEAQRRVCAQAHMHHAYTVYT